MEIWKPISGYENYEVSSCGNVRNINTGHLLRARGNKLGYKNVTLRTGGASKTLSVHRLVATAFVPNPESYPIINHIDSVPSNNHVENLEWCTYSHNTQHAFMVGRKSRGYRNREFDGKKREGGDKRSFPEIWESMTKNQQWQLKMVLEYRCAITPQTVWNWGNNKSQPSTPEEMKRIANAIRRSTGLKVYPETLFPAE